MSSQGVKYYFCGSGSVNLKWSMPVTSEKSFALSRNRVAGVQGAERGGVKIENSLLGDHGRRIAELLYRNNSNMSELKLDIGGYALPSAIAAFQLMGEKDSVILRMPIGPDTRIEWQDLVCASPMDKDMAYAERKGWAMQLLHLLTRKHYIARGMPTANFFEHMDSDLDLSSKYYPQQEQIIDAVINGKYFAGWLIRELRGLGIDTRHLIRFSRPLHTPYGFVIQEKIPGSGNDYVRTTLFDPGALDKLTIHDLAAGRLAFRRSGRNVVSLGGPFMMGGMKDTWPLILEAAKRSGAFTVLTTGYDPSKYYRMSEKAVNNTDMAVLDLRDAALLTGAGEESFRTVNGRGVRALRGMFRNFFVSLGLRGGLMYASDPKVFAPLQGQAKKYFGSPFIIPWSEHIASFGRPMFEHGVRVVEAGALAVAIGKRMNPIEAALFAVSAGALSSTGGAGRIDPMQRGKHGANLAMNLTLRKLAAQVGYVPYSTTRTVFETVKDVSGNKTTHARKVVEKSQELRNG
ncbi:MAG: hypothetical protein NTZ10_02545 [Candidatus Saganbacteria bacterium]|nr:hypothetical protein [Candidatus Saganbacteria bacterium]